ncbi:copper homeostasis protein CutC [Lentimicrobium saccharophilum]|uniref:PF03932 family protein CutC n=1 Tax=Lentimicrobium saccharophilum TaxID=1678841 RepID=A0A0S7C6E5_9BACT|nr:copper homeostasis protein CutC [Lentimicrobium saccharophilum]GAP44479.1 copper homeostasis protein CutC [Lentimicrobium saccharophilum]
MKIKIEICAGSVESVLAAKKGGADRIELCSALGLGGLTPSQSLMEYAINKAGIETFVLIRPRNGDFHYTRAEYEIMKSDIYTARACGAAGIVTGMLNTDGTADTCRMKELIEMARPMKITFHRAFDVCKDPFTALEDIIGLGCERILTSGQAMDALSGSGLLAALVELAGSRIIIMPGSGINASNLRQLHQQTKAMEYHLSASKLKPSRMHFRNNSVSMGLPGEDEYSIRETDPALVAEICRIARSLND